MHLLPLPDSWSPCLLCLSYTFCCSISLSSLIQQGKQAQFWVSWTDSSADTSLLWTTQRRSGSLILTVGRIHACSQTAASWTQCEPQHPLLTPHKTKWKSTQWKVSINTCYQCVPGGGLDTYPALEWSLWCPEHRTTRHCCPFLRKTIHMIYRIRTFTGWCSLKGLL